MKAKKTTSIALEVLSYAIPIGLIIHIVSASFPKKQKS